MPGEKRRVGMLNSPTIVTARRALGISKTYIAIAIFFSVLAIAIWGNVMYVGIGSANNASNSTSNTLAANAIRNVTIAASSKISIPGTPLLALPLDMVPLLMIVTPVVLLFVYDKNNGVLEYLLSLGMTQRDIYMRYLKAAILLSFTFAIIFVPIDLAYTYVTQGAATFAAVLPIPLLVIPFSLAVVSFMVMSMMAFSSLQKTRAGSNQPLGLAIGWVGTAPAYAMPFLLSFTNAIYADLGLSVAVAAIAMTILFSAGKLIRREKLLP